MVLARKTLQVAGTAVEDAMVARSRKSVALELGRKRDAKETIYIKPVGYGVVNLFVFPLLKSRRPREKFRVEGHGGIRMKNQDPGNSKDSTHKSNNNPEITVSQPMSPA